MLRITHPAISYSSLNVSQHLLIYYAALPDTVHEHFLQRKKKPRNARLSERPRRPLLLAVLNHVINSGNHFVVRAAHAQ
ncbi:hypothetical protein, partial [Spongiibacter tropicus]|uniref:hypothetical protein n=1 Tax=Spongiibacter tropicus TaxID=454602 RepID=UPI0024E1E832